MSRQILKSEFFDQIDQNEAIYKVFYIKEGREMSFGSPDIYQQL